MTHAPALRALRGAPLSILLALALDGPAGRADLVAATGYSTGAVAAGLAALETCGAVIRLHHRAWRINPAWRDIPLPVSAETTPPAPPVIHSLSTGAPAVLPAHAERSCGDPSGMRTTNPPLAAVPVASSLTLPEGSPDDPSPAEGSPRDPSASGLDGSTEKDIYIQAPPSNPTQQAAWPIEADQSDQPDADLWTACRQLGIGEPARSLIACCRAIQQRGPAYIRLHVSAAAHDRNRTGPAIGLAINRMYRLQPALPCGDCGRCVQCARHYPALSADSYAAYADLIRR